jgi:4-hydroxybenzoate polyprenyltransferase
MIAAAGYIINDYFDVRIDKVNKPERLVIDKGIKRRVAMGAHSVINFLALLIAFYIAWSIGAWRLALVHFFCALGLWFYSTTFKRQFLIGNLVIATFTALVPLIVVVYDLLPIYRRYLPIQEDLSFRTIWQYVIALSFFAFITTLLREIIKDTEDMEGDAEYGCQTMPIVLGVRTTKIIAVVIASCTLVCLAAIQREFLKIDDKVSFIYFCAVLEIPLLFLIYRILSARTKKDFRFAGNFSKFIMLMGICYLFVFGWPILQYIHAV